jgi:hypothetical protein
MTTGAQPPPQGSRTIRFPMAEHEYARFLTDRPSAKARLQELSEDDPALFPEAFPRGYALYGFTDPSCQHHLRCRRLRVNATQDVFTVAPAGVMPDRSGRGAAGEKAVFLRRFHVPSWAMASVVGHDAMYWSRLQPGLGHCSIVGTTVKTAASLPKDLVADAKHRWLQGKRVSIATTAGRDGLLGASVAKSASQPAVKRAYGVFAGAAHPLDDDDAPPTVNTDGWPATPGAWKALCPTLTVI